MTTTQSDTNIIVFNPLARARTDVVRFYPRTVGQAIPLARYCHP